MKYLYYNTFSMEPGGEDQATWALLQSPKALSSRLPCTSTEGGRSGSNLPPSHSPTFQHRQGSHSAQSSLWDGQTCLRSKMKRNFRSISCNTCSGNFRGEWRPRTGQGRFQRWAPETPYWPGLKQMKRGILARQQLESINFPLDIRHLSDCVAIV